MKLSELLEAKGLTFADVAKELKCADSTVLMWARGVYAPRACYIKQLCKLLDCTADELYGLDTHAPVNLNRAQSKELYQSITAKGKYDSQTLHQMATKIGRARGTVTEFEIWLRNIAEAIYKVELTMKKKLLSPDPSIQLNLFDLDIHY